MTIKGIIFDLGGVLIDVDYQKTIEAFQVLGATNAQAIYTQTRLYISETASLKKIIKIQPIFL